jgi:hypothetical protein
MSMAGIAMSRPRTSIRSWLRVAISWIAAAWRFAPRAPERTCAGRLSRVRRAVSATPRLGALRQGGEDDDQVPGGDADGDALRRHFLELGRTAQDLLGGYGEGAGVDGDGHGVGVILPGLRLRAGGQGVGGVADPPRGHYSPRTRSRASSARACGTGQARKEERNEKMGIMDFVKGGVREMMIARPDHLKHLIVYKHPDQNIPFWSQLTVDSDECALFFKDGTYQGWLPAGRHTLQTQNIPFLNNLINKFTGGDVFIAEIFFVKTQPVRSIPFGGKLESMEDPTLFEFVTPRIHGEFSMVITDPVRFVIGYHGQAAARTTTTSRRTGSSASSS